ncbi:hypothetical protein AVEN_255392-1 [Araneus ventricosus]|uniref:Uncharacterized protein n=1 Tax=Araneus ventricosus TaxID=182803 RepID=A0A4Y2HU17_ARAVE|nr:hypothetical protein AVEN_255392-1 [Araneus ventricosus]
MASLSPTEAAANQHSVRVYHQIQHWLDNKKRPEDKEWAPTCQNSEAPCTWLYPASARRGTREIVAVGRPDCFVQCCVFIVGTTATTGRLKLLIVMRIIMVNQYCPMI